MDFIFVVIVMDNISRQKQKRSTTRNNTLEIMPYNKLIVLLLLIHQ